MSAVEAHGTGTTLGDPIEAHALIATYGRDRDEPLLLGSVKSNIGHTQAAAGVAGVIKMVLALAHEELPRTLHVDEPSPHVDWSGVELPTRPAAWPRGTRRAAGVSSFGFSGTNAHVILEEAPPAEAVAHEDVPVGDLRPHPPGAARPGSPAQAPRRPPRRRARPRHRPHRVRAPRRAASATTAAALLDALARGDSPSGVVQGVATEEPKVAFLFTGQGSPAARGWDVSCYDAHPVYREAFDEVCARFPGLAAAVWSGGGLDETACTQAALFAVEVALFRLAASFGVTPMWSPGTRSASSPPPTPRACSPSTTRARSSARGARSCRRSRRPARWPPSRPRRRRCAAPSPAAPPSPPSTARPPWSCRGRSPRSSRSPGFWAEAGRKTKILKVSHAFHSPLMEPMLADFRRIARSVTFHPPRIPFVAHGDVTSPDFWTAHIVEPVRFLATLRELAAREVHGVPGDRARRGADRDGRRRAARPRTSPASAGGGPNGAPS